MSEYGYHLRMYINDIERHESLLDEEIVTEFLSSLVLKLQFRVLAGPLTSRVSEPVDQAGISSVVILYESHAAIHTYALPRSAFVDVFACRFFEVDDVSSHFAKHFGSSNLRETEFGSRGSDWSQDLVVEMQRWTTMR